MIKLKWMFNMIVSLLLFSFSLNAQVEKKKATVVEGQIAPAFASEDLYGNPIQLADLKGKKVLLIFFRNAGCPICNLHMHELLAQAEYFQINNLHVVGIYESSPEKLKTYAQDEVIPFTLLADPQKKLYQRYAVGSSFWKGLGSFFFHGATEKAKKGSKLFKKKIKQDGDMNQLTADFLIDEKGKVVQAHYAKYLGDHFSLDTIKKFIN